MDAFDALNVENKPVVSEGQTLKVLPVEDYGYYRVNYVEALPEIVIDFGALTAGSTTTTDTELSKLYVQDGEIAQYEMQVLDDIELTLKQPKSSTRFAAKNSSCVISKLNQQANGPRNMSKIYVVEDDAAYMSVKNPTNYTTPVARVRFVGWRFKATKISAIAPYTAIPAKGV